MLILMMVRRIMGILLIGWRMRIVVVLIVQFGFGT
jgi:hypothetical protein